MWTIFNEWSFLMAIFFRFFFFFVPVKTLLLFYVLVFWSQDIQVLFFLFFSLIFISWRLITSQYFSGFCHTLT